ncbi:MAG: DUF494 domain-containing protein [Burkholderiaceae bacterium]|nr:MAG: DUF494 domain-containing protein [Burkholderiaceae bacterium]
MVDVLVYLFENYYTPEACPSTDTLARKLSAAGFEAEEITDALRWLNGLARITQTIEPLAFPCDDSTRVYSVEEADRLGVKNIGFLSFLEAAEVLSPLLREVVIDRALATEETEITLELLKVTVLMVLWSQEAEVDALILEELLDDGSAWQLH